MAKRDVFVIPAGLKLTNGPDGVDIEYEGDVVIQGPPGQRLGRVRSTGGDVVLQVELDLAGAEAPSGTVVAHASVRAARLSGRGVTLHAAAHVEEIEAQGVVELRGSATAGRVKAESVTFDGPSLNARVVEGRRSIRVGRGRLQADILIAPSVVLDPSATGKVNVVESLNDLGAHAVRGCLRLADLEEMGGNAAAFLQERGLKPLSGAPEPDAAAPAPPPPVVPAPGAAPARKTLGEEQLDTLTGDESDDTVAMDEPDPFHGELSAVLDKIVACYSAGELPPAVADLREWVNRRDYAAVRDGITSSWNQLLRFHQKQGLRIQPQVTSSFNMLNSLLRKL